MCRYAVGLWTAPPDDDAGERGLLLGSHRTAKRDQNPQLASLDFTGVSFACRRFALAPGGA